MILELNKGERRGNTVAGAGEGGCGQDVALPCRQEGWWGRVLGFGEEQTQRGSTVPRCDSASGSWGVWETCKEIPGRELWESVAVRSLNALDLQARGCSAECSVMRPEGSQPVSGQKFLAP